MNLERYVQASIRRQRTGLLTILQAGPRVALEVDGDIDGLLDRAVGAYAISRQDAELILSSRIEGVEVSDLARTAGISDNTMKVRRQRAERRHLLFLGYPPEPR